MTTFEQGFDHDRPHRLIGDGLDRCGCLTYRMLDTGEDIQVPCVWYNSLVEWRIRAMRWYLEKDEASLARWLAQAAAVPDYLPQVRSSALFMADQDKRQIARLRRVITEMETTGQVLA